MTLVVTHNVVTGAVADPTALVDGPAWDANHTLTGVVSPAQGGTGVANDAASTITITGSFGITFTVSAATGLTLPTTGTLATLAGSETLTNKTINLSSNTLSGTTAQFNTALSDNDFATLAGAEELTNKTLTSSVAKGTWTASGTWTIPAVTLGGTVSGGGNQINNVIIGTSTPLAGSFTSLAYSTTLTGTSTNASALAVGRQGATNPVLQVDASTATVATGLKVKGAAAAGGLALSVITSGTNENLTLDAAGSGTITLGGTSTGAITLTRATTMSAALTYGGVTLSNSVSGTGSMALTAGTTFTGTTTVNALSASSVTASSSIALTNNQNATTKVSVNNSDAGASADAFFEGNNGTNVIRFGMRGTAETAYGALTSGRAFIYGAVDFVAMSDGGNLIFAAGGNTESGRIDTSGNLSWANSILSSHATKGVGYKTGAGGAVTQLTNRTTGVTLNTVSGAITMFSAAGSTTPFSFTVTNSAVAATDTIHLNQKSGTNLYHFIVTTVGSGSFVITFFTTGGTATDAPVINFNVIKGVTS